MSLQKVKEQFLKKSYDIDALVHTAVGDIAPFTFSQKTVRKEAEKLYKSILRACCVTTCSYSDTVPDGLPEAKKSLENLDEEEILGIMETPLQKKENPVLEAMFKGSIAG